MESLLSYLPSAATIAAVVLALYIVQRLFEKGAGGAAGHGFRNQLIMLGLTGVGLVVVILVLPIHDTMRGQLLGLIGILLSAAIALSSTTVLGNAMAGLMLRAVRNFRMGDFIRVGEHFGRVSERGLFHTEIQTEERELVTLPNLYLVTHPVTTIRSSGTIVSATVSLGYDVPRGRIEECLMDAARRSELGDPFVHVLQLGDFSVTYRISGLLEEVKRLVSAKSSLRASVMDSLHEAGIEIVSPTFMNTRALERDRIFVPARSRAAARPTPSAAPERVIFDKAEKAESLETLRAAHEKLCEEVKSRKKALEDVPDGPERERARGELETLESRRTRLETVISAREAEASKED
jgi:small-conductance mechanosensitive channel